MNKVLNSPASWKQTPEVGEQDKNLYCFSDTLSTLKGALEETNHYFISSSFQDQDNTVNLKNKQNPTTLPLPTKLKVPTKIIKLTIALHIT